MERQGIRFNRFFFVTLFILVLARSVALAQDPVKVAGDMYKPVLENDRVRVLDVTIAPGAKTAMHSHPDLVAVILEPGTTKWTMPDGQSRQSPANLQRGTVVYEPAETHVSENVGSTPLHVILIEFKQPAPAADKARDPSMPAPFKQVADNPHARIFEGTAAPGAMIPQHTHGDHITVPLTDATVEITDTDGKKQTVTFKKDTAVFTGPATHSSVVTGNRQSRIIDIELK